MQKINLNKNYRSIKCSLYFVFLIQISSGTKRRQFVFFACIIRGGTALLLYRRLNGLHSTQSDNLCVPLIVDGLSAVNINLCTSLMCQIQDKVYYIFCRFSMKRKIEHIFDQDFPTIKSNLVLMILIYRSSYNILQKILKQFSYQCMKQF